MKTVSKELSLRMQDIDATFGTSGRVALATVGASAVGIAVLATTTPVMALAVVGIAIGLVLSPKEIRKFIKSKLGNRDLDTLKNAARLAELAHYAEPTKDTKARVDVLNMLIKKVEHSALAEESAQASKELKSSLVNLKIKGILTDDDLAAIRPYI